MIPIDVQIVDCDGKEVKIGSKVEYFDNHPSNPDAKEYATVVAIADWDADVDDDTGRTRAIPPEVRIKHEDGTIESYRTSAWEFETVMVGPLGADYPEQMPSKGQVEELRVVALPVKGFSV